VKQVFKLDIEIKLYLNLRVITRQPFHLLYFGAEISRLLSNFCCGGAKFSIAPCTWYPIVTLLRLKELVFERCSLCR